MVRAALNSSSTAADQSFTVLQGPGGVQIHLASTDKYRSVSLHWVVESPAGAPRAAWAVLPDLLTRGTESCPQLAQLAARCEELYCTDLLASVTAHGPTQMLKLGIETVADSQVGGRALFSETVELLAECLHRPALVDGCFRPDHLAQEQLNLVRAIESLTDDKGLLAYRRMVEAMHAGSELARHSWGTAAEARALDEPQVHAVWDEMRVRAPARLLIIGDVDEAAALDAAERLAAGAEHGEPGTVQPPADPGPRELKQLSDVEDLAQSKLVMGFRLPPEILPGPAPSLFATAFGGGSHSRLFKRVREAEGLAYSCGASVLVNSGTLVVQAGVDADALERVRVAVGEELQRLADDGIDEDEFELSRRAQLRRLRQLADAPRDLLAFRLQGLTSGRVFDLEPAIESTQNCSPDDIVAVARAAVLDTVYALEGRPS
jgi:predicted Zn-dependent peptidase